MSSIPYIQQNHSRGCGPAALAMVTAARYEAVCDYFANIDFDSEGIGIRECDHYLAEHGFAVARLYSAKRHNLPREKWPPKPFGDIHLCHVDVFEGAPLSHWVVMLEDGKVLDPLFPEKESLHDYHFVNNVAAVVPIKKHRYVCTFCGHPYADRDGGAIRGFNPPYPARCYESRNGKRCPGNIVEVDADV